MDEVFREKLVSVGSNALDMIGNYFRGEEEDSPKIDKAFKILPQAVKIMHMNQHRTLTERSQAIRLLPYLRDEETREEYIRMTQPSTAPLLESKPSKK